MTIGNNLATANETVLVTGASSGIGASLSRLFAADGARLVITARTQAPLDALADEMREAYGSEVDVVLGDLATSDGAIKLVQQITQRNIQIDVLVNNAGFGLLGTFWSHSVAEQMELLRVNVMALTELSGHFLPGMLQRNQGGILNVSSTAAFQPGPGMATYFASKAYVQHFTEALHHELMDTPITVTSLAPGPVKTNFGVRSGMAQHRPLRRNVKTADSVAAAGYRAFRQGRRVVVPGLRNWMGAKAVNWLPNTWIMKAIAKYQL